MAGITQIISEDYLVEQFIDALVLSLNLLLSCGCITRAKTKKYSFKLSHDDISKPNNFVKREGNVTNVYLFESVDIHDNIFAIVTTNDELDKLGGGNSNASRKCWRTSTLNIISFH